MKTQRTSAVPVDGSSVANHSTVLTLFVAACSWSLVVALLFCPTLFEVVEGVAALHPGAFVMGLG